MSHSKHTVFHKQLQCFKLKYLLDTVIPKETKTVICKWLPYLPAYKTINFLYTSYENLGHLRVTHKVKPIMYRHFPQNWRLWLNGFLFSGKYSILISILCVLLSTNFVIWPASPMQFHSCYVISNISYFHLNFWHFTCHLQRHYSCTWSSKSTQHTPGTSILLLRWICGVHSKAQKWQGTFS